MRVGVSAVDHGPPRREMNFHGGPRRRRQTALGRVGRDLLAHAGWMSCRVFRSQYFGNHVPVLTLSGGIRPLLHAPNVIDPQRSSASSAVDFRAIPTAV